MHTFKSTSSDKYSPWYKALVISVALIILWPFVGYGLANKYFDSEGFTVFKVLDKSNALAYLAVIFAIQIPVFILFLQSMTDAGFIKRKILPRVTLFKEILTCFVIGTLLVLLSPRASFIYFPLVVLVVVNIFAIYTAVTIIFEPDQYNQRIQAYLLRTVKRSFAVLLKKRVSDNEFYELLKQGSGVEYSYYDVPPIGKKVFELRIKEGGYLEEIDLNILNKVVRKEEFNLGGNIGVTNDRPTQEPTININLTVHPSVHVKKNIILANIFIPNTYERTEWLEKQLLKAFKISPNNHVEINWLDNIDVEFEESLGRAIKESDVLLLQQTLELFQVFLEQLDEFVESKVGDGYGLKEAYEELAPYSGDSLSKHLTHPFETLSDLLIQVVRSSQLDIYRELIRFVYGNTLSVIHEDNVITIARFDKLIFYALGAFIYSNVWNKELSATQQEILKDILFKIKEHTNLLVYQLSEKQNLSEQVTNNIKVKGDRFKRRVEDIRVSLLGAYKNGQESIFQNLLSILSRIDKESYDEKLDLEQYRFVRCNIFMLGAYIKYKEELPTGFGISVVNIIKSWPIGELLYVITECSTKDYANNWRIDTFDMTFDGDVVMRQVPDYDRVMKSLWVEIMLGRSDFSEDIEYYANQKPLLEETTFFTNGQSSDSNNEILQLIGESTDQNIIRLRNLVNALIKVRLEWETNKLIEEPLSVAKVEGYKGIVNNSYIENSISYQIFTTTRHLTFDSSMRHAGFSHLGINEIFDKEAFIADWHSGYSTDFHAEQLGRGVAEAQDKIVFTQLLKDIKIFNNIKDFHKELKKRRVEWIAVSNGISEWSIGRKLEDILTPNSPKGEVYIKGINQLLSMRVLHLDDSPKGIYLINSQNIGQLTQKSPQETPIRVEVTAYSQDRRLTSLLLHTSPDWLKKIGDETEQRKFLFKKTRLLVEYRFRYSPLESHDVLFFPIEREY